MVEILAATLVGLCFMGLMRLVLRPDVRLYDRLAPYSQLQALRLGNRPDVLAAIDVAGDDDGTLAPQSWMRAKSSRWSLRLSELLDGDGGTGIRLLLRRAGRTDVSVAQFRSDQLKATLTGAGAGMALAVVRSGTNFAVLIIFAGVGAALGGAWFRHRITRLAATRAEIMRLELYTVAHLLGMLVQANHGPIGAVRLLSERAHGPTADELSLALGWIDAGTPIDTAFYRLAQDTADSSVARLFRLIGNVSTSGGDMAGTLRGYADQLRGERRQQIEKSATKKRAAMMLPILFLASPVGLLYVVAPIPTVFGGLF